MRKFILISLLLIIGCKITSKIDPDFSSNWQGDSTQAYAWRYWMEAGIKQQFAEKGLIQTEQDPNFIAYGFIGTWTDDEDYYWTEKRGLEWTKDPILYPAEDQIWAKTYFLDRRVVWGFCWSMFETPDEIESRFQQGLELYLTKVHKKIKASSLIGR